jgi:ribosomal protein S18 acetylase RimI-like enzyme
MNIRILTEADAGTYWALRLRALREDPKAFASAYEEAVTRPLGSVVQRFREEPPSPDNFIMGAFEDNHLIGTIGFWREQGSKNRHKGVIWGVYVAPEVRGRGIARALLQQVIAYAQTSPGLEQILLAVATTQVAARCLYRSLGFEVYGVQPRALKLGEQYVDEELMMIDLRPYPDGFVVYRERLPGKI